MRLLVVDDAPNIATLLKLAFQMDGYAVDTALRAAEARELAAVNEYDVLILDLNLPRMDGHQFLRELRQDPALASAVVFVRTTSRSPEDRAAAYARQVAGYIPKTDAPRALDEVIDLIEGYGRVVELP